MMLIFSKITVRKCDESRNAPNGELDMIEGRGFTQRRAEC